MQIGSGKIMLLSLIATFGLCSCLGAQESPRGPAASTPGQESQVALGGTSGTPGDLVVVPVYFTPAQGVHVGGLKIEVTYVSLNLKFSKLEAGSDAAGVQFQSDVKEAKNEKGIETQTLRVTASAPSSQPTPKGVPAGLLAYIVMKISEQGRSASIGLRGSAEVNELGNNKAPQKLKAFEATVDVFASGVPGSDPLVTCFFFTH